MSIIHVVGLVIGLLALVVLLCAAVTWMERKVPKMEYDERQKSVQGKAYALAFNVGLLYFIPVTIWQMLQAEAGKMFMEMYLILFLGIWMQMMLFNTYCIFHGAGLPLSRKCSWALGTCLLFAGYYFVKYVGFRDELNRIGFHFIPLLMGVGFAYMALLYGIQMLRERKE